MRLKFKKKPLGDEIVKRLCIKIKKKLKFLTDNAMKLTNLMKLMENKDVELFKFKFLTRNTNDINVFVDHFVNDFNFKVVGSGGGGAP